MTHYTNEVFWACVGEGTTDSPHHFNWSRYVVGGHENNGTLGYCMASLSDEDGGLCPEDAGPRLVPGKLLPGPVGSDAPLCFFGFGVRSISEACSRTCFIAVVLE